MVTRNFMATINTSANIRANTAANTSGARRERLYSTSPEAPEAAPEPAFITWFPAKGRSSGACVIVCPGGGYSQLMTSYEGAEICEWLATLGIAGAMLEYRMSGTGHRHPAPLNDARRAIRSVRARAGEFGLDRRKIGIMGFSAGGHLAASAATHFDAGDPASPDAVERESCRPDFAILAYAVIAFGEDFTHKGSQELLLGKGAPPALVAEMSAEKQVAPGTPPCFIFHTDADTLVPAENSVAMYLALRRSGVPAELHIFKDGPHGVGLAAGKTGAEQWPRLLAAWLANIGAIAESQPSVI